MSDDAPPTERDNTIPESDALRIGESALIPKAPPRYFDQWFRPVHGPGWHGSATVTFRVYFTVRLVWIDQEEAVQLKVSADHEDAETAFANARERGNFPDEFFEALRAPL